jgi:hypothetical protein
VLELDLWTVNFLFFLRRDLNSHHWYTPAPIALYWSYMYIDSSPYTHASQSLFYLDISPLIYLFVFSSSISPKFPLFNYKYIYWKRVNSYWYGGPHLISDFDFIISVYMLYILCVKCKFSLSIMLCQFIIINFINNNSLNIKP